MLSKETWPCARILSARDQLLAEELGAEVVVDQGRQRIDDLEVAEPRAVVALDAPQRDHGRLGDAGRPGEAADQRPVLGQSRAPPFFTRSSDTTISRYRSNVILNSG